MGTISFQYVVLNCTKHAAMKDELFKVINRENIISLHDQHSALSADLRFISGLLFAGTAPFYDHAGRQKGPCAFQRFC